MQATLAEKFGKLRNAKVEPVSETMLRFTKLFARPVPIVYRTVINEMLTTTHLAVVCAMWRYDAVFAYGFDEVFATFLRYYPDGAERDLLYKSCAEALKLDPAKIKADAKAVREWAVGKKESDAFDEMGKEDASNVVMDALRSVKGAKTYDWYYSKLFGIGLIQLMQAVDAPLTVKAAEEWAEKIELEKSKFGTEMSNYLLSMEKLKQAEQIFAEAAAREAKKTAERLAKRAEAAAKKAEELEGKSADEDGKDKSTNSGSQQSVPPVAAASDESQSS